MKNTNSTSKLSIILLVISAFCFFTTALLGYQNYQLQSQISLLESKINTKPIPAPTPTLSPTPTTSWNTYKDDVYGFEVKYAETNSDYAKGVMPTKQFLDNDQKMGYRLLLLRNTLKKQYFGINIKKVNSKISLLDYWKTQSDMAKSITKFDQKTGGVGRKEAMFFTVQSPAEYQTTVVLRLSSSYMMEIKKTEEPLSDEILSTIEFAKIVSITTTPTPQKSILKYYYKLPSGWENIQSDSGDLEVGYDSKISRPDLTYDQGAISIFTKGSIGGAAMRISLKTYEGGSRHSFIFNEMGVSPTKGDAPEKYKEREFFYNDKSCLFLENIFYSQSPSIWGMCDMGGGKAILMTSSVPDYISTLKTIRVIKK